MYYFIEEVCHMRSQKGFSSLELIAALLIVTLLVALLLPYGIRYARSGSDEVCVFNRATITRLYKAHILTHLDCSLADVLDGSCGDFEVDVDKYRCHAGGVYTVDDQARIHCSKHGYAEEE